MSRTYNHHKPGYNGTTFWWKRWTRRQYRNLCRQLLREGHVELPPLLEDCCVLHGPLQLGGWSMSRTLKAKGKGYLYYQDKEPTWTRRYMWRRYRAQCRQLIREGRYDMPRYRGSEGWSYW